MLYALRPTFCPQCEVCYSQVLQSPHPHHESSVTRVLLSWSSGKDSAWTLHLLRQQPRLQVAALLTTFNSHANRVAMHAVRRGLVEAQAERTGIPLWAVDLPWPCSIWNTKIECAPPATGPRPRVSARSHSAT